MRAAAAWRSLGIIQTVTVSAPYGNIDHAWNEIERFEASGISQRQPATRAKHASPELGRVCSTERSIHEIPNVDFCPRRDIVGSESRHVDVSCVVNRYENHRRCCDGMITVVDFGHIDGPDGVTDHKGTPVK
jgi:hypothetical protein